MAVSLLDAVQGAGGGNPNMPKPSGLAVGDILCVYISSHNVAQTWTAPDGFVSLFNNSIGGNSANQFFWKVATQVDVDNVSGFTFSGSGGGGTQEVVIFAVRGADITAPPTYVTATVSNNNTGATTGLTPPAADSLLVMIANAMDSGPPSSLTTASYAITTSNPTWTEVFDYYNASVATNSLAMAWALRPQVTATGNTSHVSTPNAGTIDSNVQVLLAFGPVLALSMTATGTSYAVTGGDATMTFIDPDVLNTAKPTTSINNTPKP